MDEYNVEAARGGASVRGALSYRDNESTATACNTWQNSHR